MFNNKNNRYDSSYDPSKRLLTTNDTVDDELIDKSKLQTPIHVFFNILKAVVGAGSFALPLAFQKGGVYVSVIGIVLLAFVSDYTIKVMIRTKNYLGHRGSYPELVRDSLPGKLGQSVGLMIYAMIVVTVIGVCTVYLVFSGKLLQNLIGTFSSPVAEQFTYGPIMMMGGVLTVISWLPSLRKIAFLSLVGDVALVVAMGCTLIYGFHFFEIQPLSSYAGFEFENFAAFYGPIVFLYGIHMLVVPLHNEMADPRKFERTLDFSMVVVVISNTIFAMLAFLLFNTDMHSPITDGLTRPYLYLNVIVDVALILDLVFTFTVIFVAGRDVVERSLGYDNKDLSSATHTRRMVVRTLLMMVCILFAVLLHDKFADLVSLISGLTMSVMCFVIPPIIYLANLWRAELIEAKNSAKASRIASTYFVGAMNVVIIVVGIATAIYTTYASVVSILKK